jgi:hypothetical protein
VADSPSSEQLFELWRQQIQSATDVWAKSVEQMAKQGKVPPGPPDPSTFFRPFIDQNIGGWAGWMNAGPASPDLLKQWKKFLDDWIEAWTKALEQVMGTEEFAQAMGKTLDQFLAIQRRAREGMERSNKATLDTLGLPSKAQVVGVARQLMDLEDRIETIDDKLDAIASRQASPQGPSKSGGKPRSRSKKAGTSTKTSRSRGRKKRGE